MQVRPVVETGYENILLVRLLLEMAHPPARSSKVRPFALSLPLPCLHLQSKN